MTDSEKFVINGPSQKLTGTIPVRGSKNAALKACAASLLTAEPVTIRNIPRIEDIARIQELLEGIGANIVKLDESSLRISARHITSSTLNKTIAQSIRSSVVLTGPLLARFGEVSFPHPGGCVIGRRPIDIFLEGFQKMGAVIHDAKDGYHVTAKKLVGTDIFFRVVSVTGTETLMMAGCLARGKTILYNAAQEPEIELLAGFLNRCGARIKGAGTNTIVIEGIRRLGGGAYHTPPDRIETGSFLILGALLGDALQITECDPGHILSVINHLRSMGVAIQTNAHSITVSRPKTLRAIDIKTHEYPGFPTDLQAPLAVLLTQAKGSGQLFETVFDGRLKYIDDLNRMGAHITLCDTHRAIIQGPARLRGREIESPDLRAGLAFTIAALVASGQSVIHNVYNIDRGYEKIEERLQKIGAHIKRVR